MANKKLGLGGGLRQFRSPIKELTVLPELKNLIFPLTEVEYENLEASILENGVEVPVDIWIPTEKTAGENKDIIGKNIVVDGHNRNDICIKHNLSVPDVKEREFNSIEEVKLWMIRKQLGRRNLSDINRTYFIGLLYNQVKIDKGKYNRKETTGVDSAKTIAEQTGSSVRTVSNASEFATGMQKLVPELKDHILGGKEKVSKQDIQHLAASDVEKPIENVEQISEEVEKVKEKKAEKKSKKTVSKPNKGSKKEIKDSQSEIPKETINKPNNEDLSDVERFEIFSDIKDKIKETFAAFDDEIVVSVLNDFLAFKGGMSDNIKLANAGFTILRTADTPGIHIKYFSTEKNSWKTLENGFSSKAKRDKRFRELLKDDKTIQG